MSLNTLLQKMSDLARTNKLELSIATSMQAVTADRIFNQGKAADNSDIGSYSDGYLKTRINKNYPSSRKVILQATRQMTNDWSVISIDSGVGLGFKNSFNADKSEWVENTYNKPIFKHTDKEIAQINELINIEVRKIING